MKFSPVDDAKLIKLVSKMDKVDWVKISHKMKNKTPRQCRERWNNYLNPELHQVEWSEEEDTLLMNKFNEIGAHWNEIAKFFKGRSGNNVRNRFLTLSRRNRKNKNTQNHKEESSDDGSIKELKPEMIKEKKIHPGNSSNFQDIIDMVFKNEGVIDIFEKREGEDQFAFEFI